MVNKKKVCGKSLGSGEKVGSVGKPLTNPFFILALKGRGGRQPAAAALPTLCQKVFRLYDQSDFRNVKTGGRNSYSL